MQEEKGDDAGDWERLVERNRGGMISCVVCYRIGVLMYSEQDGMAGNERGFVMLLNSIDAMDIEKRSDANSDLH